MPQRRSPSSAMAAKATPAPTRLFSLAWFLLCLFTALGASANSSQVEPEQTRSSSARISGVERRGLPIAAQSLPGAHLDDFVLADFAVLSGLDGSLTAIDRATGKTRWRIGAEDTQFDQGPLHEPPVAPRSVLTPLVGSFYGKRRASLASMLSAADDEDEETSASIKFPPLEGLPSRTRHLLGTAGMYVVEPGSSGRLYLLTGPEDFTSDTRSDSHHGKARLQRLPLTLPQLVALSPFSFPGDKGRVFTGSKRTRLLRIDVFSGEIDRSWEADGGELGIFADPHEEGEATQRWTYLARTDYTLSISIPRRPHLSQTLHYSSYNHQSSDGDVATRWLDSYRSAQGGQGEAIFPEGLDRDGHGSAQISCWNLSSSGQVHAWTASIDSQVVDIFDLLLPTSGSSLSSSNHPVLVPHPPFATSDGDLSSHPLQSRHQSSPDTFPNEDESAADDTLLTLSPETGSLYALSSRRFPAVLKRMRPALAGLDEAERSSRALVPGNTQGHHDPIQCRTFGCWVGRYQVEDEGRAPPLGNMDRLGIDGISGQRHPLAIADKAANPESSTASRPVGLPASETPRQAPSRLFSSISWPSTAMLTTQVLAVTILLALTLLVRRGVREQNRLQQSRSQAIVENMNLQWTQPGVKEGEEEAELPTQGVDNEALPAQPSVSEVNGDSRPDTKAETAEVVPTKGLAERHADADKAAAALLAEEQQARGDDDQGDKNDTPTKKKRRRRGKRAGAAVRARQGQSLEDDESGSDDERAGKESTKPNAPFSPSDLAAGNLFAQPNAPRSTNGGWIQTGPDSKSAQDQAVALAVKGTQSSLGGPATANTGSGALEITDEVLGYGSSGTVVFKGRFQSRLVAVKRLLVDFVHLASQEISLLESADDHPNVIRYFYKEQVGNFLFIALELCPASLGDLVEKPDEWKDLAVKLDPKKAIAQIAGGLRHLHALSIVHRDIKPQNILVAYNNPHSPHTSSLKMLLSDFGLSKRLDSVAQSSFSQTMHHPGGTAGWRAPEILRGEVSLEDGTSSSSSSVNSSSINSASALRLGAANGAKRERMRLTRAVDIFALGCLSYYLLTSGDHPFGARYEREMNIIRGQANLSRLAAFGEEGFEASHLILSMIQADPTRRPRAIAVLSHPYFWDSGKRLSFLQDVSDRLEVVEREKDVTASSSAGPMAATPAVGASKEAESEVLRRLEAHAREVTAGGDWTKKVDKAFMDDLGKWRKYGGGSVRDLLRALRNKKHHYQDMPPALRRSMGPMPDGFLAYFTRRFPKLFLHVYEVISESHFIKSETTFKNYFAAQDQE
ncbi:unnamed protein product [Parajaminaea phylloscopi]